MTEAESGFGLSHAHGRPEVSGSERPLLLLGYVITKQ